MRGTSIAFALFIASSTFATPASASSCDGRLWVRPRTQTIPFRVGRAVDIEASISHNGSGCGSEPLQPDLVNIGVSRSPTGPWTPVTSVANHRTRFVPDEAGLWWIHAESTVPEYSGVDLAVLVDGSDVVRVDLDVSLPDGAAPGPTVQLVYAPSIREGVEPVRRTVRYSRRRGAHARLAPGEWVLRMFVAGQMRRAPFTVEERARIEISLGPDTIEPG